MPPHAPCWHFRRRRCRPSEPYEPASAEVRMSAASLSRPKRAAAAATATAINASLKEPDQKIAEEREGEGDHDEAVLFYQKTLESAVLAMERQSEGLANYRLGRAYVMLGECHRAVQFVACTGWKRGLPP